jgi:hypothetical protein
MRNVSIKTKVCNGEVFNDVMWSNITKYSPFPDSITSKSFKSLIKARLGPQHGIKWQKELRYGKVENDNFTVITAGRCDVFRW